MESAKNYTYTVTYKDNETGKVKTENKCVDRARGYGASWFKTEEAARKRVNSKVNWLNDSECFTVISWTLEDKAGIIEQG